MDKVFFNRVPKTGSLQLMNLIRILTIINGFNQVNQNGRVTVKLNTSAELNLANKIANLNEPVLYIQHVSYVNFAKYDLKRPIYINLVRDPVERLISWYYYKRSPWVFLYLFKIRNKPLPRHEYLIKEFEDCVRKNDWECKFIENSDIYKIRNQASQSVFFCGHDDNDCMKLNTIKALQTAKRRVETEFAVVGTWEDANITLTVLEHYIPKYFSGAGKLYYSLKLGNDVKNFNPFKPKISEEIKEIIKRNITKEYEFYEFCKQRLYKQYLALLPKIYGEDIFNYDYK